MNKIMNTRLMTLRTLVVLGFIVLALAAVGLSFLQNRPRETVEVVCYIGSEKADFLSNEEVQNILANDYGLKVDYTKMGSIEQAYVDTSGVDCLWPSNTSALEIYRAEHQEEVDAGHIKHEVIFNSPIVLYSWQPIVEALTQEGVIAQDGDVYYADTTQLMEMIASDEPPTWQDLGVTDLHGSIRIVTTDPTRSNSGNMFYGLMANMLIGGDIATETEMRAQLPTIKAYYDSQGLMEESSGILFDRFVSTGMGANPIIANYESLLIEFSLANHNSIDIIRDKIRIIYPKPTVWSSHPLIAKSDAGNQLIEALKDERLQSIAWEQHGFRSGLFGVDNDPSVLNVGGIPADIQSVIELPKADAMLLMLEELGN